MSAIDHTQVQGDIALVVYASEGTIPNVTSVAFQAIGGTWNTHYQNGSEVTLTGSNEITIATAGWYEIYGFLGFDFTNMSAAITRNGLLLALSESHGGSATQTLQVTEIFTAHREFKMGGQAFDSGGNESSRGLSLLWSGYAQAGDTFEIVAGANAETPNAPVTAARMIVRRLGSHLPEYAGQGWWTSAIDLTKHSSFDSNDYVLSAAETPAENLDNAAFVLDREGKFATEIVSPRWSAPVAQEPLYVSGPGRILFGGNDYLEDDANAGDWDGETSFCVAITLDPQTPSDTNHVWGISNVGGEAISISENGGIWLFTRGAKSFASHSVDTAQFTLVYSYDASTGLANMWQINQAGTTITQHGTDRDFSGTLGTLTAKRIGSSPSAFDSNFSLRRVREAVGDHANGRPGLLQAIADEIARDDN